MKKGIIKAFTLIISFAAAMIGFGYYTNQDRANLTIEMAEASYPVLSLYYRNFQVAELHGYRDEMKMISMRDSIVPVKDDREITVELDSYGRKIDQIRYEIRSLNGERLIADRVCDQYSINGNIWQLHLVLENLLQLNEEYQLQFLVTSGTDTIRYYTRLIQTSDEHLDDYFTFVNDFHTNSMDKENAGQLSVYLEPNGTVKNNDLSLVTINASLAEISWADFQAHQLTEPVMTIAELSDNYAVILLKYILTSVGTGGELEYYNVKEYYRISYSTEGGRCYLHNFERSMNQIFRADGEIFYENSLQLGIRDAEVEYKKSESGQITSFVQQGELWSYNENNNILYRIFSFRGYEGIDARENYDAHDIRILSVDESGSMNFAVYGYMNRGIHEGQVGLSIYRFDSVASTIEEILYIPSDRSYGRLKTELADLIYENAEGMVTLMMQGTVYQINTDTGSIKKLAEHLSSDGYCVSLENHLLILQQDTENGGEMTVIDMEKNQMTVIETEVGEMLKPIGFLDKDFVYGVAKVSSPRLADGSKPLSDIVIYDAMENRKIKEYSKSGYYISDVSIDEYVITLKRMRYVDETYIPAEDDAILNHAGEGILDDNIRQSYDNIKQMQVQLLLDDIPSRKSPNVVTAKEVLLETIPQLELNPEENQDGYYTYAKGDRQAFHTRLADAIADADQNMGVVVDEQLQAVWKRAKKLVCAPIEIPEEAAGGDLTKVWPEAVSVDLTGCRLTQTLYYISQGIPVKVRLDSGLEELIVGYDSANIWVYDTTTHLTNRKSITNAQEQYNSCGNRFLAFLD